MGSMPRSTVAIINLGQRQSVMDEDSARLPSSISQVFLLDPYSRTELLKNFAPDGREGNMPISIRTREGDRILVSKSSLIPELNKSIKEMEQQGIQVIVVACTNEFDLAPSIATIMTPGRALHKSIRRRGLSKGDKIALFLPAEEQRLNQKYHWSKIYSTELEAFAVSPLVSMAELELLGKKLKQQEFNVVIGNCYGYTIGQTQLLEEIGLEVYSGRSALFQELLGGNPCDNERIPV